MVEEYKVIPIGRAKDLRGQKFGRLTVVDRVEKLVGLKSRDPYWLCKCECGAKSVARGAHLVSGNTQSCGCLYSGGGASKDLTGRVFGQLKAVRVIDRRTNNGNRIWECECNCGKTAFVSSSKLVKGHTRSCGHLSTDGEDFRTKVNLLDSKLARNNTSGHKGVSWNKNCEKWKACIYFQGGCIHLGYFSDIQVAMQARKEAEDYYFKPVLEQYEDRR